MKILIAEDDALFRRLLQQILASEHEIVLAEDGGQAWAMLQEPEHPPLALLDWVMPVMTGPQICRKVREDPQLLSTYLIILTAKNSMPDISSGLRAGADDYVTKPFIPEELRARVRIGERLVRSESSARALEVQLREASARQKSVQKLLPICPTCRKIRSDNEYWRELQTVLFEQDACSLQPAECPTCASMHAAIEPRVKTASSHG